jgi:hypothetical protein
MQAIWLSPRGGRVFRYRDFGLYYAFERGPGRLVAPVIAGYLILVFQLQTCGRLRSSRMKRAMKTHTDNFLNEAK